VKARTKEAMLAAFRKFSTRIASEYDKAFAALERDDYVEAQRILAELARSHASTSLSLRSRLIREGKLTEDK
jgi:hypothetical protein